VHQVEVLHHAVDRAVLAMGETTMRFFSSTLRTFSGVSIGGTGLPPASQAS
jgi:hypothetical protein